MENFRRSIIDAIVPYFARDERYFLLVGDMGFGAIDKMREQFPHRIINCGIMEQASVGIAAGMAMSGMIPVYYTIVNFLVFRAIEQVRNDVALQKMNVKFVGTGANNYFHSLGHSHCCGEEDVTLMNLAGVATYDPYTAPGAFSDLVDRWITSTSAGYMRV